MFVVTIEKSNLIVIKVSLLYTVLFLYKFIIPMQMLFLLNQAINNIDISFIFLEQRV